MTNRIFCDRCGEQVRGVFVQLGSGTYYAESREQSHGPVAVEYEENTYVSDQIDICASCMSKPISILELMPKIKTKLEVLAANDELFEGSPGTLRPSEEAKAVREVH